MKNSINERFLRTIGILTPDQFRTLQRQRIAIAGLGMGGSIFLNLVRMGFRDFHVADPDIYERTNVNRQRLATESTLQRRKDECLIEEARAINPEVRVQAFGEGVSLENLPAFLSGVDWVIDVVDIYAMKEKLALEESCARGRIPVISAACIGFGASFVVFRDPQPSFAELSGIDLNLPRAEQLRRFVDFITPEVPDYMKAQLDLSLEGRSYVPFVVTSVEFAAAAIAVELSKQILGIGERVVAPNGIYIDPMRLSFRIFDASASRRKVRYLKAA